MLKLLKCLDKFHRQHVKIAQLVDNLEKISGSCFDFDLIHKAMDELILYTKEHFHDEEVIMEQLKYPKIDSHRAQHREFSETVQDLCYGKCNQTISDPVEDLITFCHEWADKHIKTEDEDLDDYIADQIRSAVKKIDKKVLNSDH